MKYHFPGNCRKLALGAAANSLKGRAATQITMSVNASLPDSVGNSPIMAVILAVNCSRSGEVASAWLLLWVLESQIIGFELAREKWPGEATEGVENRAFVPPWARAVCGGGGEKVKRLNSL